LDDVESFDAYFFGIAPREAALLDPQQRIFLECAWHALEDAGYAAPASRRGPVGVFAGSGTSHYLIANLIAGRHIAVAADLFQLVIANDKDYLASRVSYKFNLTGPSLSVQTA